MSYAVNTQTIPPYATTAWVRHRWSSWTTTDTYPALWDTVLTNVTLTRATTAVLLSRAAYARLRLAQASAPSTPPVAAVRPPQTASERPPVVRRQPRTSGRSGWVRQAPRRRG